MPLLHTMMLSQHAGPVATRRCLKILLLTALVSFPLTLYLTRPLTGSFYSFDSPEVHHTVPSDLNEWGFNTSTHQITQNTYAQTQNKTILFWTPFYAKRDSWELLFRDTVSGDCPISNCRLTRDRRLLSQADAVVFHILDIQLSHLPKWRTPNQVWVLFCLESPAYPLVRQRNLSRLNDLFNWTMTYRWDSDVPVPYGLVLPRDPKSGTVRRHALPETVQRVLPRLSTPERSEHLRPKERLAAWMVSNCNTPGRREQYVTELRKHIHVDVYGECGKLKCGRSESVGQQKIDTNNRCDEAISHYKFYLAFENSLCPDYVTEKFFRTLTLGLVPVVFGGAQYSAIAPHGSYIDARNYEPHQLAHRLLYLQRNETAYHEFFRWRDSYIALDSHPLRPLTCGLCRRLHELPRGTLVGSHGNLDRWYAAEQCSHWQPAEQPLTVAGDARGVYAFT